MRGRIVIHHLNQCIKGIHSHTVTKSRVRHTFKGYCSGPLAGILQQIVFSDKLLFIPSPFHRALHGVISSSINTEFKLTKRQHDAGGDIR
ncbi:hypothetical protein C3986_00819 [Escherichia coli]|nr:hypothetical protein C3986_00819 [Escherichia coli]